MTTTESILVNKQPEKCCKYFNIFSVELLADYIFESISFPLITESD